MQYVCLIFIVFWQNAFSNEIDMVADVINSYNQPTSLLLRVCWNSSKRNNAAKTFYKFDPPRVVQFIKTVNDLEYKQKDTLIVADMNCPKIEEFLQQANVTENFRSPYRWLIIDNAESVDTNIPSQMNGLKILIDSNVLIAKKNYKKYNLYSIYRISSASSWKIEPYGIWTSNTGVQKFTEINIPSSQRRRNLEGTQIGTSMVVNNINTKKNILSMSYLNTDHLTNAGYRLMWPLYYFMNATLVVVFTDTWGYLRNGSYDGMIGEVTHGTAELTGTVMFFTKPRIKVLEFLSFPLPSSVRFVFRQPSLSYQNNIFALPFKPIVWLCILCLILLLLLIVFITGRWENFKCRDVDKLRRFPKLDNSEISMMVIGAVTQQGSYTEFKGTLGRVVMFLMFFVFLFLHTSYSANIVALLQSTSNDIKTLADLLHSKLELGAEDTPYNRQHLSTAVEPIRKAIYEKKIAPAGSKPNFMSLEEGVKRMQTKPFAFHMYLGSGYRFVEKYFLEHEKCGLQEIQFNHETIPWLTCRKNTPFKEIFKVGLLRNQEHGINDRVNRLIYSRKPVCSAHGGTFGSVNMTDFYPALLMLAYGMIASLLILAIECLASQRICLKNRI